MKTIVCYKVTIKNSSIILRDSRENCYCKHGVSYEIGKVTTPKIGKLYCFTSLEDAKDFTKNFTYFSHLPQIFKGIGTNPKYMKLTATYYKDIESFWTKIKEKNNIMKSGMSITKLPHSSVCVDSFEPLFIVYGNV